MHIASKADGADCHVKIFDETNEKQNKKRQPPQKKQQQQKTTK